MIFSISLTFVGCVTIAFALINRINTFKKEMFFNIGMLSLIGSLYSFTRYETIIYIFSEHRAFIYFLEYAALMFLLYPVNRALKYNLDPIFDKYFIFINNIIFINFLIQTYLTFTKKIEYHEILAVTHGIMLLNILLIILSVIFTDEKKYRAKKILKYVVILFNLFVLASLIIFLLFREYFFLL